MKKPTQYVIQKFVGPTKDMPRAHYHDMLCTTNPERAKEILEGLLAHPEVPGCKGGRVLVGGVEVKL
jgi:hypothetical protein